MSNSNFSLARRWGAGLLILLFGFLSACQKEEVSVSDYLSGVTEIRIKGGPAGAATMKEISLGQSVEFLVFHTSFDGCGEFSRHETRQEGNDLELTFYVRGSGPLICTDNIVILETPYLFMPRQPGTFHLKFRQQDENTYLTYTVIVK